MIKLLRDFVLIHPDPPAMISKGGIFIPDMAQKPTKTGTVIGISETCELEGVKKSDKVFYNGAMAIDITYKGTKFKIVRAAQVWAVLPKSPAQ